MQHSQILIVEDDFLLADYLAQVLREAGHIPVGPTRSVSEALSLIARSETSAAILDFRLGSELVCLVGLELHSRGIPFIVVSGYEENVACAQMPFRSAYLRKPWQPTQLLAVLAEAIEGSRGAGARLPEPAHANTCA